MKEQIVVTAQNQSEMQAYRKAGADEIVLAVKDHSMSALQPVTIEEIEQSGPVSLLLNRMYFEEDLPDLKQLLRTLETMQIESIYFTDPAVLMYAGNLKSRLIYRPETLAVSSDDTAWWLSQGIQSVSVSPLLTEEELLQIIQKVPEAEVTIHGRLVMSVSRRKLLSAYKDYAGVDADVHENRTLSLVESKRQGHMPVYENDYGTMIYTDFVQESFEMLQKLQKAGCHRFYIDSVYSEEDEMIDAIQCCRAILNGADGKEIGQAYRKKYPDLTLSTGYYGQKTIL